MKPVISPIQLRPILKRYDWGDPEFIPKLLDVPADGDPYAEAWYGAHPAAPALAGPERRSLLEVIAEQGAELLGPDVQERFGGLPYLLKLLSAKTPLSIQVHPTRSQAQLGYERENRLGVALDQASRNYKDANHKPEVLLALTGFEALCGFRRPAEVSRVFKRNPELSQLLPEYAGTKASLKSVLDAYFSLDDPSAQAGLAPLVARLRASQPAEGTAEYWALTAHLELSEDSTIDRGILFVLLLNLVRLSPGEAVFLPAGVPHAYLQGAGIELMATSDNVLRAGLTRKHVDVDELMDIVRFDAGAPSILRPKEDADGELSYALPSSELALHARKMTAGQTISAKATGPDTLLALPGATDGTLIVRWPGGSQELSAGSACLIPAGFEYEVHATSDAQLFRAGVPNPNAAGSFRGRHPTELGFGTSGLRGLVTDITDLEAYINTRGFVDTLLESGDAVPGMPLAIGGDLRPSTHSPSRSITRAVAKAVVDAGLEVVYCGQLPTPALTLFGVRRGIPSIMVTGSHIPFDRNGIKFNKSSGEVLKTDEAPILEAVRRVRRHEYSLSKRDSMFDDAGWFREGCAVEPPSATSLALTEYVERYLKVFPANALSGLRIVMFEHSAVGRELVPEILRGLGAEVHGAGRSETFVAIDTEAIADERLVQLQALADEACKFHGPIDAIISTDGDSDRPMLLSVNALGKVRFFNGDVLGAIVADYLDADGIAVPISANDLIDSHFTPRGVTPVRTRIGSPWVIAAMQGLTAKRIVGWEANGGFLTGSAIPLNGGELAPLATRDAVLPLVAALHQSQKTGTPLSELPDRLPARFGKSGLLDEVDVNDSRKLLQAFSPNVPGLRRFTFDADSVTASDFDSKTAPLDAGQVEHLLALRTTLAEYFTAADGFGALQEIDVLDGLRFRFHGGDVAHVRPSGNAPQLRIYAISGSVARANQIAEMALAEPAGLLRTLLLGAKEEHFVSQIRRNIQLAKDLFTHGSPAAVIGSVAGSAEAAQFWQEKWEAARLSLGARAAVSQHEDLPVNQAFGLLLLWQRLRPVLQDGEGALLAFVFGEGSRAAPWTEAESGQKPALSSFVAAAGAEPRLLSVVELALRCFAPVESVLRRSGFNGVVIKWGDEVQIPTRDLNVPDPLFAEADVVRFVSMRAMTEDEAANKDWVGVDANGHITRFIPRRPLSEMRKLATEGLIQERGGQLYGGVNLGSIAVSRALLDALLAEFEAEVNDHEADRRKRPDLDPQLFTALTIAADPDEAPRLRAWKQALQESDAMRELTARLPNVLERLRRAVEVCEQTTGRQLKLVAMDFGDQYWGDIGQHSRVFELFMALGQRSAEGKIARSLASLSEGFDEQGNLIAGDTQLGKNVSARNSVLVNVKIDSGEIEDSVLLGTRCRTITAKNAFDVQSIAPSLTLASRAGSYKVVSTGDVSMGPGERLTSVFLPDAELKMRVHETTDLRNRKDNYEKPILDNSISFAELHSKVVEVAPKVVEARRQAARTAALKEIDRQN